LSGFWRRERVGPDGPPLTRRPQGRANGARPSCRLCRLCRLWAYSQAPSRLTWNAEPALFPTVVILIREVPIFRLVMRSAKLAILKLADRPIQNDRQYTLCGWWKTCME
ncbi:MAG: hypothetical protein JWP52_3975, partial [Rhizobacter sp.]|nr:hypothetical protein [Rhizobacter sp.]